MSWIWISWAAVGLILGLSISSDIRHRRIPNAVTFPGIIIGLSMMVISAISGQRPETLIGYFAALTLIVIFCLGMERGGIWAAGDSKLFLAALVWINGVVSPLWGTGLMIGLIALLHAGLVIIRRCWSWKHTCRLWWMAWALPSPSGQAGQYPGSILIAATSIVIFLLSGVLWRGAG